MLATDILKVLYAPHKAFKQIVQNPKYLGAIIVFILFVAVQTGFYYSLYSRTYYEQTSPSSSQLGTWTENATLWTASAGAVIGNNYVDMINSTFYGNGSLQFTLTNSNSLSMELSSFNSVNCGPTSFQNLSLRIKIVEPQTAPSTVTLYLYSLNSANYFQYDLTPDFTASTDGFWNKLTVPVGSGNWQSIGSPTWGNITGLKLNFAFPSNSDITLRMEGLFFRGIYESPIKTDSTGFIIYVLQLVVTQFLFEWLLFTGLLYIIIKGLKGTITWKPLFVAVGFALIVTVVQTLINIAATSALPSLYYPIEFLAGVPGETAAVSNAITAAAANYSLIASVLQLAAYVWIAGLGTMIVRALIPEFSWTKSLLASAASLIATILLLSLLGV